MATSRIVAGILLLIALVSVPLLTRRRIVPPIVATVVIVSLGLWLTW